MELLKDYVKLFLVDKNWKDHIKKFKYDQAKKIILIGTPLHGNLGDHAIAEEEMQFLRDYFPDYELYEFSMQLYNTHRKLLEEEITNQDVIIISGGGWMGNLWLHNEIVIRNIVSSFPDNLIVIFPQTVFYTQDEDGQQELLKTKTIFAGHKRLFIFFRDQQSVDFAEQNYVLKGDSHISYYPDIVLYASRTYYHPPQRERQNKINVCLRKDIEGVLPNRESLLNRLKASYTVEEITTVVPKRISSEDRREELNKLWNEFASAKLTVTDRLHGMLFSVLTDTPCIAFDNKTNKVFGVYKWIEDQGLVVKGDPAGDVVAQIERALKCEKRTFDRTKLENHFAEMADEIRRGIDQK